jgi:hypothetical protein
MIEPMNYSRPRWSTLRSVAAAAAAATFLGGCGSGSDKSIVASACTSTRTIGALKLVLGNAEPIPRVVGHTGTAIEVVSSYHGNEMTFPTAHPFKGVCELSQHRGRDGTAIVVYKALRRATIKFFSTYTHATNAMMPAMLGRFVVR